MKQQPSAESSETNRRIYDFLRVHPIGILSTVSPEGKPHGAAIYFSVDEGFDVTFTTKRGTQKHNNLENKNQAMITVYEAATQTTVQLIGEAEVIHDTSDAQEAFKNMVKASVRTSEAGIPPIAKLNAGDYVAYRLKLQQIRMAVFARPDPGGYDLYETIDFSY